MVLVHRLKGEPFFLNADLIETIESTPDTTVTLADGRRVVLADSPQDIVDRVRYFRASVIVATEELRAAAEMHRDARGNQSQATVTVLHGPDAREDR